MPITHVRDWMVGRCKVMVLQGLPWMGGSGELLFQADSGDLHFYFCAARVILKMRMVLKLKVG